jgi:hypothetical protein
LAAARWNQAAEHANAGASAPDSFGRVRGCTIWMRSKKRATTAIGMISGSLPDGGGVKLRPNVSFLIRLVSVLVSVCRLQISANNFHE